MNSIILREKIEGEEFVTFTKKPALRALKCECCGRVFQMQPICNDQMTPSQMVGIFNMTPNDANGRGLGNMFEATVCNFQCADTMFLYGWKELDRYQPYVQAGAELIRVQLGLTTAIVDEDELVKAWEALEDLKFGQSRVGGVTMEVMR